MRIINLVSAAKQINNQLSNLLARQAESQGFQPAEVEITHMLEKLGTIQEKILQICAKQGGSPEDLPTPSFRAYQWIKFLGQRKWLLAHLFGLQEFYTTAAVLSGLPYSPVLFERLQINCTYSGYLYRNRQSGKRVTLEINEGFIGAPREAKECLLEAALKRRTASRIKTIRAYSATEGYAKIQAALQANAGANRLAGKGDHYDLKATFERLNRQYFEGQLAQPRLQWSARRSLRRLGYYHPESDSITISKRLDSADVPEHLLAYVLYHEMLHKKIGLKTTNGRRYAHTRAFREAEKEFEQHAAAEKAMRELGRSGR